MKKIIEFFLFFICVNLFAQDNIVSELKFTGLKRTKESFLKRLVKTKTNAVYDSVLVAEDIERLKRLPGIASASFSLEKKGINAILVYDVVENFTIIPGLRIATANDGSFAYYRISAFEFNLFGNNQLFGGFYEKNIFNSYGLFWEHPFLFSDKLGIGLNYQDRTTEEPVFFTQGEKDYRFNSRSAEAKLLFSFDFKNEAELGASFVKESYLFEGENPIPNTPLSLEAEKLVYRGVYRYVDLDIDYLYFDGIISEFTGEYVQFLDGKYLLRISWVRLCLLEMILHITKK